MFDERVMSVMTHPDAQLHLRVEAARAAGFHGLGLRPRDLAAARRRGLDDDAIRGMVGALPSGIVEIDAISGWGGDDRQVEQARTHERRIFDVADTVGARHVTIVGDITGPRERAVELLAGLADRAAEHGLAIGLEYLPWTNVATVTQALELVLDCGRENAKVVIDTWHHFRGDADWAALQAVPGDRIAAVQFNDGFAPDGRSLEQQTFDRCLPGGGVFDLKRFLEVVATTGTRAPLCLEVISPRFAAQDVSDVAAAGMDAMLSALKSAGFDG